MPIHLTGSSGWARKKERTARRASTPTKMAFAGGKGTWGGGVQRELKKKQRDAWLTRLAASPRVKENA